MKFQATTKRMLLSAALSAVLTILCGLVLSRGAIGEPWVNASYDYLFRFGSHPVTNDVVLIQLDNEAYAHFQQSRDRPWSRELHARLLNRLADDRCSLVVMDSFFRAEGDPAADTLLANAMRRQPVVLMAEQVSVTHPALSGAYPNLPTEKFLTAARTNWGVAWLAPDLDSIVRRHWPFPSPGPYPSLPWTAAKAVGARLSDAPVERWLRYYTPNTAWTSLGYRLALTQPTNYFRNKIVFIGNQPRTTIPNDEPDEFSTPSTRWTGQSTAGVQIIITAFLNLLSNDWLERTPWAAEATLLAITGMALGWFSCRVKPLTACALAISFALLFALIGVSWSHFTKYWFPWMVLSGAQVPCALLCGLATYRFRVPVVPTQAPQAPGQKPQEPQFDVPITPGYELIEPPFGHGAYGDVWLARDNSGKWCALKVVYQKNFGDSTSPYEREFNGIKRYQPISNKHPGLLTVHFVSPMKPDGYFYYVMDLGDSTTPGWEKAPMTYQPRDLVNERRRLQTQRLPARECIRIGLALTEAIGFLHKQGLTHRDIKPQNVIFVNDVPKLADMGLIAEIRPSDQPGTYVGTPGYMPPLPEQPGTPQADIYGLGMMLYVLSTGRAPTFFPELATSIVATNVLPDFLPLNTVILKACHPDQAQRYATAEEMREALLALHSAPGISPG